MELQNALMVCIAAFMVYNELATGGNMSALMRTAALAIDNINATLDMPLWMRTGRTFVLKNTDISVENVGFSYDKRKSLTASAWIFPPAPLWLLWAVRGAGKPPLQSDYPILVCGRGQHSAGEPRCARIYAGQPLKNYSMVFRMSI